MGAVHMLGRAAAMLFVGSAASWMQLVAIGVALASDFLRTSRIEIAPGDVLGTATKFQPEPTRLFTARRKALGKWTELMTKRGK